LLRTSTSFSVLTLSLGSCDPQKPNDMTCKAFSVTFNSAQSRISFTYTSVKLGTTFDISHLTFKKFIRIDGKHIYYKITDSATNLRPTAFGRPISDAIFPLPVFSNSTPNVHSLSLWTILIARRPYNPAKTVDLILDYRISGRQHSPGLYPTPHFQFRFPVSRRETCKPSVY